jgi:1-acyl-sn-glycerol-3-phosphate acyltransferase
MQFIRSVAFDIYLTLWTLLLSLAIPILICARTPATGVRGFSRIWVRGVLAGLKYITRITHREIGRNNIPEGPCLFVSNHQSPWETIASAVLLPDIAIVAKTELFRIPAFGWALRASPMIMLDREGGAASLRKMVSECQAALANGRSILIFPEGTRKSVSAPVEFKRGFELLYRALGVPVVPVAVNSGLLWGPDRPFRLSGIVTISYLPPVPPGMATSEMGHAVRAAIQREVETLIHEPHQTSGCRRAKAADPSRTGRPG